MSLDPGRGMPSDDRQWYEWCFNNEVRRRIVKRTNETRNSTTTLAPDSDLVIWVPQDRTVIGRIGAWFVTDAAADFKFAIGSSGSTVTYFEATGYYATPGGSGGTLFNHDTIDTAEAVTFASGSEGAVFLDFRYNGTDDAFVSFDWAQNTSNAADTTVEFGSFLEYDIL